MLNYKGQKCISCGLEFKDGDDIVVCPDCGTPYHRECYIKEGKCINDSLHAEGKSWSYENSDEGKVKCQRCGGVNGEDFEYCSHCGFPLKSEETERPFNNEGYGNYQNTSGNPNGYGRGGFSGTPFGGVFMQNSVDPFEFYCRSYGVDSNDRIGDIGIKEYFKYIRSNPMYYILKFLRFSKEGIKRSFNFPAFFFPHIFFFFRKMYKQATVYLTFSIITTIFTSWFMMSYIDMSSVTTYSDLYASISQQMNDPVVFWGILGVSLFSIITRIVSGIFANYWYYKKATKDVNQIVTEPMETMERDVLMARKGGTSIMFALLAYFIANSGVSMLMNLFLNP